MMAKTGKAKTSAGRPSGGDSDKVRGELLDAARTLFLSNEFKAVSIRQIAEAAGVNGAMVSYYFGSKQGLYLAMVEELLMSLQQSLESAQPGADVTIADFSERYCQLLVDNPWWPNFIVREVLFSDGAIRAAVIQKMGTIFAPKLLHSIQQQIAEKQFRSDLNPALTLLSLMGMTVFPFLARPLIEQVLNVRIDDSFARTLAAHNTQLILHGVQAPTKKLSEGEVT